MLIRNYEMKDCAEIVRREGRISFTDKGVAMDWSACGFSFNFEGCEAVLHFEPFEDGQPIIILAILDGVRTKYALSDGRETVTVECQDLVRGNGVHTLTLLRLSEGGVALVCTKTEIRARFGTVEPAIIGAPAKMKRRLIFFGDSYTCGYGNLGRENEPGFRTYEEDPTLAYAYLTASALGAAAEIVSISGQGIVRNCNGDVDTPIPQFFRWESRTVRNPWNFADNQGDAIVINAGTNDMSGKVSDGDFADGVECFNRAIREVYPDKPILWIWELPGIGYEKVLGEVLNKLNAELGNIYYLSTDTLIACPGNYGANGHPSFEGAIRTSNAVCCELCKILHW